MNLYDHVENVKTFMTKAGQTVPKELTTPSEADLKLRASLVMEEAMELVTKGLGLSVRFDGEKFTFEKVAEPDIVEAMDAAADIMWVGVTGVSVIFGADIVPILKEVDRSNLSKFIDGYRRDDGKWVKGPSYSPADIQGKLKPLARFSDYYALPNNINGFFEEDPSWFVVDKKFWEENKYVDDCSNAELSKNLKEYGLYETMESCYEIHKDGVVTIEEQEAYLKSLGFTILEKR